LTVFLNANLLVVLALNDERAPLVEAKMREWASAGETLHAPALMPYEAANALLRAAVAGSLSPDVDAELWATISAVPVTLHPRVEGAAVIAIGQRLGRKSAYDAACVALAQSLSAQLWTLDGPLARNARGVGLPVGLLGSPTTDSRAEDVVAERLTNRERPGLHQALAACRAGDANSTHGSAPSPASLRLHLLEGSGCSRAILVRPADSRQHAGPAHAPQGADI
jgi:predicted nucleic acid-binding protein